MHGPTCIFLANLTPLSLRGRPLLRRLLSLRVIVFVDAGHSCLKPACNTNTLIVPKQNCPGFKPRRKFCLDTIRIVLKASFERLRSMYAVAKERERAPQLACWTTRSTTCKLFQNNMRIECCGARLYDRTRAKKRMPNTAAEATLLVCPGTLHVFAVLSICI
jgi:hypothetical protein